MASPLVRLDALVVVLFDDGFAVWKASRIPVDIVITAATRTEHVNGWRVYARNELLDQGDDWIKVLALASLTAVT